MFWRTQTKLKGLTPANGISPNFSANQKSLADSNKNNYALIISDMRRGDSPDEGLKLLRIRNKNYPSTPLVIYSSSKSLDGYSEDAENEGAELVTTKITELLGYIQPKLLITR